MISRLHLLAIATIAALALCPALQTQSPMSAIQVEAHLQPVDSSNRHPSGNLFPSAVLWLKPLSGQVMPQFPKHSYTLTQNNKMFTPHLLVVPVGGAVSFPNKDPFFHNVFSLFDGKRFDLGLYESGTAKEVMFSREGVSYIFCNIHPDMSAVILSLATPLYSIADRQGIFHLEAIPPGSYAVHVWVEGQTQDELDRLVHTIQLTSTTNLGAIPFNHSPHMTQHSNKFNQPYDRAATQPY